MLFHPQSFISYATTNPKKAFWIFAIAHLALWTLVPALTCPNAPLDVIEGYAWGREWLLGTYKHPPMQSWWLQTLAVLTNRADWGHFLASQVAVVVTFWAVWKTGRRMVSKTAALISVLLLEGVIYYNFTSIEFNPNVLQLPFWALSCFFFHCAVKNNRWHDWVLLAVAAAGGMYSKYSTALLLLVLSFLMVAQPLAARRFKGYGPYLTLAIFVALVLPHFLWLRHNEFLPFTYALDRMQPESKPHVVPNFIFSPMVFLAGQLFALIPIVLMFFVFGRNGASDEKKADSFDQAFLHAVTFGPFVLTLLTSAIFGFRIRDMWGMPFWSFLGLWAVAHFHPSMARESLTRFVYAWSVVVVASLGIFWGSNILYPYVEQKTARIHFPGRALAQQITEAWHQRYNTPLRYVIGDTWVAGNVAFYSPERPHVFIKGDKSISTWIKSQDLKQSGGVIVWCVRHCLGQQEPPDEVPDFVENRYPQARIQKSFFLARQTEAEIPPVKMGWAIVPPGKGAPRCWDQDPCP